MQHTIEVAYLGVEVRDRGAVDAFLGDVVGLVRGEDAADGAHTWRNDDKAQRLLVHEGPADDAVVVGVEAVDEAAFEATLSRLAAAGFDVAPGTDAEAAARRVDRLARTTAPWGVPVEVVLGLAEAAAPFSSAAVPGGFLTGPMGFGHVVFATTAFDEAHRFATEALGMRRSDWLETELAPGIPLEVAFYHCNPRHHSLALARAPFDLPQRLHHVMLETRERDDVGAAFDRVWASDLAIANGLGRHDNDGMFSFYVVSPAGFQVEIGHGARVVGDDWDDDRCYDRISRWGHQPVARG